MSQVNEGALIALSFGDYELDLAPRLGGSAATLRWRGHDLLRPAAKDAAHAVDTASFPMAPYANRIARGRFSFAGRDVRLASNFGADAHPLHGSAWLAPWQCEESDRVRAVLARRFERSDWPWRFSCRQEIGLDAGGALLVLAVRNDDEAPMPLSFGHHPFFLRPPGAVLRARVEGVWRSDAELLPVRYDTAIDLPGLAEGTPLDAAPFVDNCHAGWDGEATLSRAELSVRLTASPEFSFLHLYIPRGQTFFCAEPVSAVPNAMNMSDPAALGLRVLAPGESASGWMRIAAEAR
ncbi:MAG: aldose 1-epimerase [Vitreimonas sp.]